MKSFYKISLVVFALLFITPAVAFASWWNPFTWPVFNKKTEIKTEQIAVASSTVNITSQATSTKLKKDIVTKIIPISSQVSSTVNSSQTTTNSEQDCLNNAMAGFAQTLKWIADGGALKTASTSSQTLNTSNPLNANPMCAYLQGSCNTSSQQTPQSGITSINDQMALTNQAMTNAVTSYDSEVAACKGTMLQSDQRLTNTQSTPAGQTQTDIYGMISAFLNGSTVYGSNGLTYTRSGDSVYGSDGTDYTISGNTVYGPDGDTYTLTGSTLYSSDGTTYTQSGNNIYGSDGSSAAESDGTLYVKSGN